MDLLNNLSLHNFLLVLMDEESYIEKSIQIVKALEGNYRAVYICLGRPYHDIFEGLKKQNISNGNFFFIDLLSSHYKEQEKVKNCIFISDPIELDKIKEAIRAVAVRHKPDVVVFDNISSLLMFQENSHILKFTHDIVSSSLITKTKIIYYAFKLGSIMDNEEMLKDIAMFADSTMDLSQ